MAGLSVPRQGFAFAWSALLGYDIFISYRRSDGAAYAEKLWRDLKAAGIAPFLDRDETPGGAQLTPSLMRALRRSRMLLVLLTPDVLRFGVGATGGGDILPLPGPRHRACQNRLASYIEMETEVLRARISDDGRHIIAVGGQDAYDTYPLATYLWQQRDLLEAMNARQIRSLSPAEWIRFLGSRAKPVRRPPP